MSVCMSMSVCRLSSVEEIFEPTSWERGRSVTLWRRSTFWQINFSKTSLRRDSPSLLLLLSRDETERFKSDSVVVDILLSLSCTSADIKQWWKILKDLKILISYRPRKERKDTHTHTQAHPSLYIHITSIIHAWIWVYIYMYICMYIQKYIHSLWEERKSHRYIYMYMIWL